MLLYGANGYTKSVIDCLLSQSVQIDGIFDDDIINSYFDKYNAIGKYSGSVKPDIEILLAIEDNLIRRNRADLIMHDPGNIVHKSAIVSVNAIYEPGTVILHNAVVMPDVNIGRHCIINAGAIVEHDTSLEDYVNIAQGSTICSNVRIGTGAYIGPQVTVLSNVRIGEWATIGACSTIINDVPDYAVVVGSPGKVIKYKDMKMFKGAGQGTFTPYK